MGKWTPQYEAKRKYQSKWEKLSVFKGWLQPVPIDTKGAWCSVCKVRLKAHKCDLLKHADTDKHKEAISKSHEEDAPPTSEAEVREDEKGRSVSNYNARIEVFDSMLRNSEDVHELEILRIGCAMSAAQAETRLLRDRIKEQKFNNSLRESIIKMQNLKSQLEMSCGKVGVVSYQNV